MESLLLSNTVHSKFTGTPSLRNSSVLKNPFFRHGFSETRVKIEPLRISRNKDVKFNTWGQCRALKDGDLGNGFGMIEDFVSGFNESTSSNLEKIANENMGRIISIDNDGSEKTESKAGLYRTPISSGVQSATCTHGLPQPALAVRNLMEQARFAHLCTKMCRMHRRSVGFPFGSLVDFAPDPMGHPIFQFSPLGIHTRNLLADPRCTLVVQAPGWSGLSNARVTLFGDIVPVPNEIQGWAHQHYGAKHKQWETRQWENFSYYRMQNITDIFFVGGFGTVQWVDVKKYETIQPDKIAVNCGEKMLKELNAIFSKPLREILSGKAEIDDAALISIDSKGFEIKVRQGAQFSIQRLSFHAKNGVETIDEAKRALQEIVERGL